MTTDRTSHAEFLIKLRRRINDAVSLQVIDAGSKEIFETTLIQIMNEAERQRLHCNRLSADFEQKAQGAKSQASAYEAMISVVYGILNGFVRKAEADHVEIKEQAYEEELEKADVPDVLIPDEDLKVFALGKSTPESVFVVEGEGRKDIIVRPRKAKPVIKEVSKRRVR